MLHVLRYVELYSLLKEKMVEVGEFKEEGSLQQFQQSFFPEEQGKLPDILKRVALLTNNKAILDRIAAYQIEEESEFDKKFQCSPQKNIVEAVDVLQLLLDDWPRDLES